MLRNIFSQRQPSNAAPHRQPLTGGENEEPVATFTVTKGQRAVINQWLNDEVYPTVIAEQKKSKAFSGGVAESCWEMGYPYSGAIGGGVRYEFSPTSLGSTLVVSAWGMSLNVTDFDSW